MKWRIWGCLAAALVVACTGDDPTPSSATNSGPDGGPGAIGGQAQDFSFTVAGPTTTTTLVQGGKATITVVVARKPDLDALKLPMTVKVTAPAKIAGQATIAPDATSADVELTADATIDQGNTKIEITGDASGKATTTATVDAFVRGKPGSIDTTFGTAGVFKGPTNLNVTRRVFPLADGKLVYVGTCAGGTTQFCISRVLPNGTLDTTYGTNGIAKFDGFVYGTAIQSDGKILVGSKQQGTTNVEQVFRVLADGSALDPSFGTGGVVTVTVPEGTTSLSCALAAGPDGSTAMAFNWTRADNLTYPAVLHLDASGSGLAVPQGLSYWGWAANPPGQVAHLGYRATGQIYAYGNATATTLGVVQITAAGGYDSFFGSNGRLTVAASAQSYLGLFASILEQSSHKLVMLGYSTDASNTTILSRATANGTGIDSGFGQNGISQRLDGLPSQAVLDGSDRIVVLTSSTNAWVVYRLTADGAPDLTFGDAGRTVTTSPLGGLTSVALQPDGRIVVLGYNGDPYNPPETPFIVRFWP